METNIEHEAARFIRSSGVNVQLCLTVDYMGDALFCLRATPWRNSTDPDRMILVAAPTILDALLLLVEGLHKQAWTRLDWKAIPLEAGIYTRYQNGPVDLMERVARLRHEQALKRGDVKDDTDELPF